LVPSFLVFVRDHMVYAFEAIKLLRAPAETSLRMPLVAEVVSGGVCPSKAVPDGGAAVALVKSRLLLVASSNVPEGPLTLNVYPVEPLARHKPVSDEPISKGDQYSNEMPFDVPPELTAVTVVTPAALAGRIAVICVDESMVNTAFVLPNLTDVTASKFSPVITMESPPPAVSPWS
jgi:hypothetical protein